MSDEILVVNNLKTSFFTQGGEVQSVRGVRFTIHEGEVVGIVGESGSGKSVTAKSILSLIKAPGRILEGEILFHNENLLAKSEKEMQRIRGNQISMIFQDPMTSLNPVIKIGQQLTEVMIRHRKISKAEATKEIVEIL